MPFTVSHIAAVLPLRKSKLDFTAMAIGAMAPDFSYVFELVAFKVHAHSIAGLFKFCIPASLIIWYVYSKHLQAPWSRVFPWLGQPTSVNSIPILIISIAIGALTHIGWDSFTHTHGEFVEMFPVLKETTFIFFVGGMRWYNILQHVSTILGGMALCFALMLKIKKTPGLTFVSSKKAFFYTLISIAVVTGILSFKMVLFESTRDPPTTLKLFLARIAFRMLGAMMIVAVAYPLISHQCRR